MFLVFFNDFNDCIRHSSVIKFADDTVIYANAKSVEDVEHQLNKDLSSIANYFDNNDLIVNLKKGKTESLLFGTSKKLNKKELELNYNTHKIHNVNKYKYLGITLDPALNLSENFDIAYKKASSRLRLMHHLTPYLTSNASITIYKSVVIPILTYCGITNMNLNATQLNKLSMLEGRAKLLIHQHESKLVPVVNLVKRRSCVIVHQCLSNTTCTNFNMYFKRVDHAQGTRSNKVNVVLPKVRLSCARNGFYYMGAKRAANNNQSWKMSTQIQRIKL